MDIQYRLNGRVTAVLIGEDPHSLVSTRKDKIEIAFTGIIGDKHSGLTYPSGGRTVFYPRGTEIRNYRQLSIISEEEMAQVAAGLRVAEIKPEWLGANLLVSGIKRMTQIPPFTRMFFEGGVVLVVQRDNEPCGGPGKIIAAEYGRPELGKLFVSAADKKRGLVAVVEHPGEIRCGEDFRVEIPEQIIYSPED